MQASGVGKGKGSGFLAAAKRKSPAAKSDETAETATPLTEEAIAEMEAFEEKLAAKMGMTKEEIAKLKKEVEVSAAFSHVARLGDSGALERHSSHTTAACAFVYSPMQQMINQRSAGSGGSDRIRALASP